MLQFVLYPEFLSKWLSQVGFSPLIFLYPSKKKVQLRLKWELSLDVQSTTKHKVMTKVLRARQQQILYQLVCFSFRSVSQKIHARTRPTTVTNMLSVSTSVTSVTQCTSASVGLVMLEMVSCVERTPTWMAGPIKTLCVALMLLITARRYVFHCIC